MRPLLAVALVQALASAPFARAGPLSRSDQGSVVLRNFTAGAGVPPVTFQHWRHRAMYTCRVCHVDVGFAMEAGGTRVSASTNRSGFHCGACHDGKATRGGKRIFASCSEGPFDGRPAACGRCHRAETSSAEASEAFDEFARPLPRTAAGTIDWDEAEARGLLAPADSVEGASVARRPLPYEKEITIALKRTAGIVFSHKKHARWSGCELCHPEIFPMSPSASFRYSMQRIMGGEHCGACHGKVAFPLSDCDRCHTERPKAGR
ncbi:MAG TPA: c(7)-type cytochrome triheme domain-containing protein [Anaeromyxobacter sp.]